LKGIQAWIPFKRKPWPGVDVYFWAAWEKRGKFRKTQEQQLLACFFS
jgi:hypothetical protein